MESVAGGGARRMTLEVAGRVQGVYFRETTRQVAARLGLTGYVRNLASGGVEIVAEGPTAALHQLLAWARQGPDAARVDAVSFDWGEATGIYPSFRVSH